MVVVLRDEKGRAGGIGEPKADASVRGRSPRRVEDPVRLSQKFWVTLALLGAAAVARALHELLRGSSCGQLCARVGWYTSRAQQQFSVVACRNVANFWEGGVNKVISWPNVGEKGSLSAERCRRRSAPPATFVRSRISLWPRVMDMRRESFMTSRGWWIQDVARQFCCQ